MNNLRFSTALHILVLLEKNPTELLTSEFIAGSINVHPVVVRREIKILKEAGYIEAKKGKIGGCALAMNATDIVLGDVYKFVNRESILGRKNQPNPACSIGKQMNNQLEELYAEADANLVSSLNKLSLRDFSNRFK